MKKNIITPHDRFTRTALSERRVAKAFFESHLPAEILKQVDLNTLRLTKETFVDEQLAQLETDLLFSASMRGKQAYLYLLVEAQSTADWRMPLRLLKYMLEIMEHHTKMTGEKCLPVVYPIVLYNGRAVYNEPLDLFEMFGERKELAKTVLLQPFHLIDLTRLSDEELRDKVWLSVLERCLKHIHDRNVQSFLEDLMAALRQVEREGGQSYVEAALNYLLAAGEVKDSDVFLETVRNGLSKETRENMMTIAEQIEAKGIDQGLR